MRVHQLQDWHQLHSATDGLRSAAAAGCDLQLHLSIN